MEWLLKRITSNQIFYSEFHEHSNPKKKRRTELGWLVGEDGGRFYRFVPQILLKFIANVVVVVVEEEFY